MAGAPEGGVLCRAAPGRRKVDRWDRDGTASVPFPVAPSLCFHTVFPAHGTDGTGMGQRPGPMVLLPAVPSPCFHTVFSAKCDQWDRDYHRMQRAHRSIVHFSHESRCDSDTGCSRAARSRCFHSLNNLLRQAATLDRAHNSTKALGQIACTSPLPGTRADTTRAHVAGSDASLPVQGRSPTASFDLEADFRCGTVSDRFVCALPTFMVSCSLPEIGHSQDRQRGQRRVRQRQSRAREGQKSIGVPVETRWHGPR
jgi:hypothetical protein